MGMAEPTACGRGTGVGRGVGRPAVQDGPDGVLGQPPGVSRVGSAAGDDDAGHGGAVGGELEHLAAGFPMT